MPDLPAAFLSVPIAHRGLHDATRGVAENSRAAFIAAMNSGYGIELDVQLSADGEAMVFHDYTLHRLTAESGPVRTRSAAELRRLRLKAGGEGIPDLAEILSLVRGRVPLLIEIKDQDGALGPDTGVLEARVAELLHGYDGPVAVMSFNPHAIAALAAAAPDVARGLVTDDFSRAAWNLLPRARAAELNAIPDFDRLGASFISHNVDDLGSDAAQKLRARGFPVLCWTVKNPNTAVEAYKLADNITFEGFLPEPRGE